MKQRRNLMAYEELKATKVKRDYSDHDYSISRSSKRKIKRSLKKAKLNWILAAVFLIVGAVGGFLTHWFVFKNDTYQMMAYANGEIDVVIGVNEDVKSYTELGVKCVAFGKDYSKDCTVKYFYRFDETEKEVEVEKVDETKEGFYYAVYSCPAGKYKTVTLIRNIQVCGGED